MEFWQPQFNEARFQGLIGSKVEIKCKVERTITFDGIKLDVTFYIVRDVVSNGKVEISIISNEIKIVPLMLQTELKTECLPENEILNID